MSKHARPTDEAPIMQSHNERELATLAANGEVV